MLDSNKLIKSFNNANQTLGLIFIFSIIITKINIINFFDLILDSYIYLLVLYIGWIITYYIRLNKNNNI